MQSFQTVAHITDDGTLTVVVPPEFPKGQVQVTLTAFSDEDLPFTRGVKAGISYTKGRLPRTSLADWADEHAEHWGNQMRSDDVEGFTGRRF